MDSYFYLGTERKTNEYAGESASYLGRVKADVARDNLLLYEVVPRFAFLDLARELDTLRFDGGTNVLFVRSSSFRHAHQKAVFSSSNYHTLYSKRILFLTKKKKKKRNRLNIHTRSAINIITRAVQPHTIVCCYISIDDTSLTNRQKYSTMTTTTETTTTTLTTKTTPEEQEQAYKLLKESSWLEEASDALLHRFAAAMTPVHAKEGQIFVQEGQPLEHILILERGSLLRTKLATSQPTQVVQTELRHLRRDSRVEYILEKSIVVDKLEGKGRISGILHSIRGGNNNKNNNGSSLAFATVTATSDDCKVWLLAASDFRAILREAPEYAMDVMAALARELRSGSKSLRGLIKAVVQSHDDEEEGQDGATTDNATARRRTVKVMCFDATSWTTQGFESAVQEYNREHKQEVCIDMHFTTERLTEQTATFAAGYDAVCLFVNDTASAEVLKTLSLLGIKMIAMRCAGFDRVDTKAAKAFGLTVARVPAYSPYAVAEMAVALLMAVNRKIHHATNRVKMANFTLDAGLLGMDIHGKTIGVMGTGKIGQIMCDIMLGFGIRLICYDVYENQSIKDKGGVYVSQDEIFAQSDILMLAMPLIKPTYHTINMDTLSKLKPGVIIINTSRGGLVDTKALLKGLKSGVIGGVGMDVYENEQDYFFRDWSAKHMEDEDLMHLLGNNNVVLTAHQAFFTKEAVNQIVQTTLSNLYDCFVQEKTGQDHPNNCIPADASS